MSESCPLSECTPAISVPCSQQRRDTTERMTQGRRRGGKQRGAIVSRRLIREWGGSVIAWNSSALGAGQGRGQVAGITASKANGRIFIQPLAYRAPRSYNQHFVSRQGYQREAAQ
eukprot:5893190-Pyramimonas_sp.AAC.1